MKAALYIAILLLTVLHQDFWLWDDTTIVLGFLPAGLAYHVLFSLLTAALWCFAIRFAWPEDAEAFAEMKPDGDSEIP
jgi:hypothetical protein